MESLGNDFIVLEEKFKNILSKQRITQLFDRKKSIGCDQLIFYKELCKNNFELTILNQDGSTAEACGNAFRALSKYLMLKNNLTSLNLVVMSKIYPAKLINQNTVSVNMGVADTSFKAIKADSLLCKNLNPQNIEFEFIDHKQFSKGFCVSVGNPHIVFFKKSMINDEDMKLGKLIEYSKLFPNKINVEFAYIIDEDTIYMRPWERGSGDTLACGSGAAATFIAAYYQKLITQNEVIIQMPGGNLKIKINSLNEVILIGDGNTTFYGSLEINV